MDIIIPPNLQSTVTNQKFLLYNSNDHHRRLLIFASKEQLDFLNKCESRHCARTFAVGIQNNECPKINDSFSILLIYFSIFIQFS